MSFYFLLKAGEPTHRERESTAASWKWYRMMDDALRPKHHINPPAQCDSPKVAAAVSSSTQAQANRQADCEEEDTLVMKREEPDWCSSRKWSGERRRGRGDHWSKKSDSGTLERESWVGNRAAGEWIKELRGIHRECSKRRQTDGHFQSCFFFFYVYNFLILSTSSCY